MRSHANIVKEAGASALARSLQERGHTLAMNTPQRWLDRDSIPFEYWDDLDALGVATRDELKTGKRARKRPEAKPLVRAGEAA